MQQRDSSYLRFPMPPARFYRPSGATSAEGFQISAIPYASGCDLLPSRRPFGRGIPHIHDSLCLQPRFTSLQKAIWQRDSSYPRFPMPPAAICHPPEGYLAEGFPIFPIPYASSRDLLPKGQLSCMPPANKKFESHGMSRACRVAVRSTLDITRLSNRIPYRGQANKKRPPDHPEGFVILITIPITPSLHSLQSGNHRVLPHHIH